MFASTACQAFVSNSSKKICPSSNARSLAGQSRFERPAFTLPLAANSAKPMEYRSYSVAVRIRKSRSAPGPQIRGSARCHGDLVAGA